MFISVGVGSIFFLPAVTWPASSFDDIYNQEIHSGFGTLEFRVKLLRDVSSDPHNHVLLLAVSSDLKEFYKVEIIEDQVIVWRDFGGCLRTAFSTPHNFRIGGWYTLKVTWNKESTKFYINNNEIEKLGLFSTEDSSHTVPCIRLGHDDNYEIANFRTFGQTEIGVDPKDQEFVRNCKCPNLPELMNESAQEEYRNITTAFS